MTTIHKSKWISLTLVLLLGHRLSSAAQSQYLSRPSHIETTGVPPIPATLVQQFQPYTQQYGLPLAGWNPAKHELWLKGLSSVTWISRVASPGAPQEISSIYLQESGIYDLYLQPQGKYLAYTRDANGDETFQLYLYDIGTRKSVLLSDGRTRSTEPAWSNKGDSIAYSSSPVGSPGVSLRLVNPLDPKTDRLFVSSSGGYLKAYDWSPDDQQVVYCDFASMSNSTLWLANVRDGDKTRISPKTSQPEHYDYPQFSKDGKRVYVITDHGSDFRRLAYIDLASRKISYVPSPAQWDVDEFQLSPDGKTIAFLTNEDGISKLYLFNIIANKERPAPELPSGVISDLKWRTGSNELAFNFKSSKSPNDVYLVNTENGTLEPWVKSVSSGVDTEKLSQSQLIHWPSFDKRIISGFLYRPPTEFKGKHPVIIDIHGGPQEQYRPGFLYEDNFFLNELGVAKIYPNVRGSAGYGKRFLQLDDAVRREDAVKDLGALLDWIKTQPDLDADRVLVQGGSYGGYLALSVAYTYSDQIRGTISESGMTDLVSCAEETKGWRRDIQREEFGDDGDPKMRQFMKRVAPLNNVEKIKKPLLIFQGQNDPRVPVAEATKLVAATSKRIPVWYVLAKDEGHGFTKRENRDYRLYASILFTKEFLLK
ncbi:MAG TPA: prolyl oligopeptidase family serine peptidase [Pyrinomonadaceae bacterium]